MFYVRNKEFILKCIMTLIVVFVAYIRQPEMLIEPRFWAEEGTNYFSYAYNHTWLNNLLSPQFGYNTLYNSIATSIAMMVPLDYAPYVTTYLAFFVQVFVSSVVIWWNIPILNTLFKKFAVALFIQVLAYARIWVTTIGVQYWLCILSFLILLYDHHANNRKVLIAQYYLLALNGLTGILSCVMIPAFLLKAIKTKSKPVIIHTAILMACLLVQISVFTYSLITHESGLSQRLVYCSPVYMISKLIKFEFSAPFLGLFIFNFPSVIQIEAAVRNIMSTVIGPSILSYQFDFIETGFGLLIIIYISILSYKKFKQLDTQIIMLSLVLVTIISTLFSVNMSGGPRYTFAPSIMIMVLIVGAINDKTISKFFSYVSVILVLMSLSVSFIQYRPVMMNFSYDPSWPKWKEELSIWRTNNNYPIKIWPPPWQMNLHK
ncbi:hypothetical protein [Geotalea uraniireducens]|uniref:Uncharacterized protein n=1 Tax=Geotalea uraniireducens (strain Rf4) TaxID=351605 RepID=A5GA76_GEOUR|nr:hypothetical protein [Geotalea uraniireducens]ABQ25523.1 hypothetical protein Gura_1322 [Geotalea uraniireducens Rf4]